MPDEWSNEMLRILLIEENADDADAMQRELLQAGMRFTGRVVTTRKKFLRSLRDFPPDVVIADFILPEFSAMEALRLLKRRNPSVPFILVTDNQSEEVAAACIQEGVDDYLLKTSLLRLPSAVSNALQKKRIEREKQHAEMRLNTSNEQLRALSAHLQLIREEERMLIAREIHDELGQALTGIRMDLAWLMGKISATAPPDARTVETHLASVSQAVDSAIRTVRRIATELRPKILDDLGLIPALEWLLEEFQKRTGVRCAFRSNVAEVTLDQDRSTACFRIVQESLTNVGRHAKASQVVVHLRVLGGRLKLEIADNGRGITEREITNEKSLGLLGMKERAFLLGGSVVVAPGRTRGTVVSVEIPV